MKTLQFTSHINAPKETVWYAMLDDEPYREWTSVFGPGSHYVGNWEPGSKILFVAPSDDGGTEGMVSTIAENRPHEFVSIKHLGFMKNGVEDTESDQAKAWEGAHENYTLRSENEGTTVLVDLDTVEEFADYFEETWPKALDKLKVIAEK
jgi:hypothetical protein